MNREYNLLNFIQKSTSHNKKMIITLLCFSSVFLTGFTSADKTPPTIKLTKGSKVTINYKSSFNYKNYVTVTDDQDENVSVSVNGSVNTKKTGTYKLNIKATDASNNSSQQTLTVVVKDMTAPTLTLTKSSLTLKYGAKFNAKSYIKSATDNKDGNVKSKVKITSKVNTKKAGTYTVKYTVKDTAGNSTTKSLKVTVKKADKRTQVVEAAKSKLGCYYKWGAVGPSRFDCSGLVVYCYKTTGKKVAHSSSSLKKNGKVIPISKAQPGDVVWRSGHVGIYVGNGKVIHSPSSGKKVSYTNAKSFKCAVRYF